MRTQKNRPPVFLREMEKMGGVAIMKRAIIMIISMILMLGCKSSDNLPDKLYINGEESGIPDVYFKNNDVYLPLLPVLLALGGEYDGDVQDDYVRVRVQDKVFIYYIGKHVLLLESELQTDPIILLSPKSEGDITWLNAQIYVDYSTLNRTLTAAGIDVQMSVDFDNEKLFIWEETQD